MDRVPCLRVSLCHAQRIREDLQSRNFLDRSLCMVKEPSGTVLLPILSSCLPQIELTFLEDVTTVWCETSVLSKKTINRRSDKLQDVLQELVESHGEIWTKELREDLPRNFQRHGDLVLLGKNSFSLPLWNTIDGLWQTVAKSLGAKRLARMSRISNNGFRAPQVTILLGDHSWVKHVDNGITYEFDVTKCMFSAGNVTEKLRIAGFDCRGETVVDLYAGIGYFTLPYLVHAGAAHVHACEWNPNAIEALRKNLVTNRVQDRCTIHPGDNRQLLLLDIADRVNLGLIPSSEDGWPVACRLLNKTTGGFIHIHQNVTSPNTIGSHEVDDVDSGVTHRQADWKAFQAWADSAAGRVAYLLRERTATWWKTNIRHIERVKSYAPHVHHVVLDLECRPA
ncbi:tRNA wybutosine-synthesizing protein 2 homolog [Stigmatopora nigra]